MGSHNSNVEVIKLSRVVILPLPVLHIHTALFAGKLTLVVGGVGSGKSSLLSAFLGEMVTLSGSVTWKRSVTALVTDHYKFGHVFLYRYMRPGMMHVC